MRSRLLPALFLVAACVQPTKVVGVSCGGGADCVVGSLTGTCESTGFCSYPDATCMGGQRYSPAAEGPLGNMCVGGEVACGAQGQACCNGTVCGTDLVCDATSKTCVCGGEDQVCCAGSVCAANLACGDDGTCACGAIDEPCCGGSTCDTGVSCVAGVCSAGVAQIGLGMGHVCAVRPDKSVWCWGADWKPYSSTNFVNALVQYVGSPLPHRIEGVSDAVAVGSSEFSACARKTDGTVWCWGHNESGQLGDGTVIGRRDAKQIAGLSNVTMLEGGRVHMCAVGTYNGAAGVWCWGRGALRGRGGIGADANMGRLGNNNNADSPVPVPVVLSAAASAGQTVRALSVGAYHSCMVMSDDKVWCWGRGSNGQLGNGGTSHSKVPVAVTLTGITIPNGVTITGISCTDGNDNARGSTCMVLSDGTVYCWGDATNGTLGDNTSVQRTTPSAPVDVTALAGDPIVELDSGQQVHCGRTQAGNVWCWGNNKNGIIGTGATVTAAVMTPARALNLTGAVQLDVSHRSACAVDGSQRLFCWGTNIRNPMLNDALQLYVPTEVKP